MRLYRRSAFGRYFWKPTGVVALIVPVAATIALAACRRTTNEGELKPNTDTLDFGEVFIGTTARGAITWKNIGGKDVEMDGAGEEGEGFEVVGGFVTTTVKVNGSSPAVSVDFSPAEEKAYTGKVTPADGMVSPQPGMDSAALKGSGVARMAKGSLSLTDGAGADAGKFVAKKALDFGDVLVGKSKDLTLLLKNSDATNDFVIDVQWSSGRQGFSVTKPAGLHFTVPKSGSVSVTITFSPADKKTYSDGVMFIRTPTNLAGTAVVGRGVKE